jgi:hypothetical protein
MSGVFISKGMKVGLPVGGLQISIDPSGGLKSSFQLQLHFDVVPSWSALALEHLANAHNDKLAREQAWSADIELIGKDASGGVRKTPPDSSTELLERRAFQTVEVAFTGRRLLKDMLRHFKRRDRFSD